jgi:hypothetical protein
MWRQKRRAGKTKLTGRKMVALLKMVRGRSSTKLTIEKAREIRASELSNAELSRIYNVAHSQISAIRRGQAWREMLPTASVFSLGGA